MKDITIPAKRIKKELIWFLAALGLAFLSNVYSIIRFNTSWSELYSQLGYVLMIGILIYLLSGFLRIIYKGSKSLLLTWKKKENS